MRERFRLCYAIALALVLPMLVPGAAFALSAEEAIRTLDERYYYPQQSGVTRVSARIDWKQMDVRSLDQRYLTYPGVRFLWDVDEGTESRTLRLIEGDSFSEQSRQALRTLQNYREFVVPVPLAEKLRKYKNVRNKSERNKLLLSFATNDPAEEISRFDFVIDTKRWVVDTIKMAPRNGPASVTATFRYLNKNEKWMLTESIARFSVDGNKYIERTSFDYRRFDGVWLLHRLEQTVKQKDLVTVSNVLSFSQYRIQKG